MLKGPLFERTKGNFQFRPLIDSYRRQIDSKEHDAVQKTRDLNARNTESSGARQTHLREIIHAGQVLNPMAADKCIYEKTIDRVRFSDSWRRSGSHSGR